MTAPREGDGLEPADPGVLVAAVLEEEGRRQAKQQERFDAESAHRERPLAAPEREPLAFGQALRGGGVALAGVLCAVPFLGAVGSSTFGVLGPDLQRNFQLTLGELGTLGALVGLLAGFVALLFGRVGDRCRRPLVVGACALALALATLLAALANTSAALVIPLVIVALVAANEGPVQGSIAADAFPLEARQRAFGVIRGAQALGLVIGPAAVGAIASTAGGLMRWRWPMVALSAAWLLLAVAVFRVKDPRRGAPEMKALRCEDPGAAEDDGVVPLRAALARLRKIRSFGALATGGVAVGCQLVAVPVYSGVFLHREFHLGASGRGLVSSLAAGGMLVGALVGGRFGDPLYAKSPAASTKTAGLLLAGSGAFGSVAYFMPQPALYTSFSACAGGCLMAAFVMLESLTAAVVPHRFRATGLAMLFCYLSLVGGVGGALLLGRIESASSLTVALSTVVLVSAVISGAVVAHGSRYIRRDIGLASLAVIEEYEQSRRTGAGLEGPLLQIRNVDFSYGPVQVLFDVNIDVHEGEVLALLGTNGAGKSTVLRAVSGLSPVDRGVIRFRGRTITFDDPSERLELGVVQVPGGKATFPGLSVRDNLRARGFSARNQNLDDRIVRVLEQFPVLRDRLDQPAGTLSGGEQQMLAIAGAMLLEPKLLLIDELSLGLAPVVVQQLLEVIGRLKAEGLTMVIVEQSVNVALSIADRAVFMEKGQVRFEGPAQELLERDDLVRAVFLGGTGG